MTSGFAASTTFRFHSQNASRQHFYALLGWWLCTHIKHARYKQYMHKNIMHWARYSISCTTSGHFRALINLDNLAKLKSKTAIFSKIYFRTGANTYGCIKKHLHFWQEINTHKKINKSTWIRCTILLYAKCYNLISATFFNTKFFFLPFLIIVPQLWNRSFLLQSAFIFFFLLNMCNDR